MQTISKLFPKHTHQPRHRLPQNLDGWEKKFHAIPFSLWVLDAPLEWPIRGFSLSLALARSLSLSLLRSPSL